MEQIDWNDLQLEKQKTLRLVELRRLSYHRYSPPNAYMMYLLWAMLGLGLGAMMMTLHFTTEGFPHPARVAFFWTMEAIFILGGALMLYRFFPAQRRAKVRWDEMELIRASIDNEMGRRDKELGLE